MTKQDWSLSIGNSISTFANQELAFLTLQGKTELQIRDKIAWHLQNNLPNGACHIRKEYGITREKCDLALLDTNMLPVCLVEFKAHTCATDEHLHNAKFYDCCVSDISKMHKIEQELLNQGIISSSIPKFYIFFQVTHEAKNFPTQQNLDKLICYYNIVLKGYNELKNSRMSAHDFIVDQWTRAQYQKLDKTGNFFDFEFNIQSYYGLDLKLHAMIMEV